VADADAFARTALDREDALVNRAMVSTAQIDRIFERIRPALDSRTPVVNLDETKVGAPGTTQRPRSRARTAARSRGVIDFSDTPKMRDAKRTSARAPSAGSTLRASSNA